MSLAGVSSTLWRERELLELLLFKLEEEQLVLASGRTRWLSRATKEVEMVLEEVRRAELLRAVQVDAAGVELGLGSGPSLRELAEAADEPWKTLLLEHRQAFLTATAEIQAMAEANRDLLTSGFRAAREALLSLGDGAETYTASGAPAAAGRFSRLVDEAM
ncbi:flagellar export chaperone FlgN [Motilibacter aurantiacus]|uniref:flagellar export chaperone FlgN n=1 Tax=Motilibacter aurantiacus TaxID=2714955 RepID=UPI00140E3CB6|nr:flagellar export chaperone FlgN [Motilibacter aurantiacus]NHC46237.1 flagellar protein FlgN [Motilibacter aurantiacus]